MVDPTGRERLMGVEFIVDERGKRTKVILDIEKFERLVEAAEDAEDIRVAEEARRKLDSGEEQRTLRRPGGG